jgi:DNA primase
MERSKLKALFHELGISSGKYAEYKDSGDNIQVCCPFHGERRPSCGINVDTEVGHCFHMWRNI